MKWIEVLCLALSFRFVILEKTKPNIIVILADDLGWNDVGFHGSDEIPTPNIDALAYNGVILNGHYTQALCTPSRAAFLTGKYPIHSGMQHLVILESEPWGLGLNETLLPQHLKKNGYSTHAIGKWHLGFVNKAYTPTYRGFDSHFGYWQGFQDYYDHTVHATFTSEVGYDMRRNMSVAWDANGKYSTDLFTEEAVRVIRGHDTSKPMFMYLAHLAAHTGNRHNPLQAPDDEIAKFAHIADPERRIYAAMVSLLDKSVGEVISALREKRMLENSIVLFMSDNGGQTFGVHANHASNHPLRGMKNSPWEGGSRCVSAIWSPLIKNPQRISSHLMHLVDWMPTLFSAAGLDSTELGEIDGLDMWKAISENSTSPRVDLVYNIDDIDNYAAVRKGDWKYVYGSTVQGKLDQWYGSIGKDLAYTYDVEAVLKSRAGSALAGLITTTQIHEKHLKDESSIHKPNETGFLVQMLGTSKIYDLRQEATLRCPEINPEGLPLECNPLESPCLFNLKDDPCERVNLAKARPTIVISLENMLLGVRRTVIEPRNLPADPKADPKFWNGTWSPWQDDYVQGEERRGFWTPLAIGLISGACVAFGAVVVILVVISVRNSKQQSRPVPNGYDDDRAHTPLPLFTRKINDVLYVDRETST